jgi:hypothetical protein
MLILLDIETLIDSADLTEHTAEAEAA